MSETCYTSKVQTEASSSAGTSMVAPSATTGCQVPSSNRNRSAKRMMSAMLRLTKEECTLPPEEKVKGHAFIKYTFKKPTFCDFCLNMLLDPKEGRTSINCKPSTKDYQRQGLRCKICKHDIHENCIASVGACNGAPLMGPRRYAGPPNTISNQESQGSDNSVDSDYEALQKGRELSLGLKMEDSSESKRDSVKLPDFADTYVAMYKYESTDERDLELRVGDKLHILEDKNEWCLGEREKKSGFFPSNRVAKMELHETVYIANKIINTTDASGKPMNVRKNQVVFVNTEWPTAKENQLYCRAGKKEGYLLTSDVSPA